MQCAKREQSQAKFSSVCIIFLQCTVNENRDTDTAILPCPPNARYHFYTLAGWTESVFRPKSHHLYPLADLGGGQRGHGRPGPVKTSQKKWPPCASASFASHVVSPRLDKLLDPLVPPQPVNETGTSACSIPFSLTFSLKSTRIGGAHPL